MLLIAIHHDGCVTTTVVDARHQRHLMAEAARQMDDGNVGEVRRQGLQNRERIVPAAVEDVNDVEKVFALKWFERGRKRLVEGGDALLFVVHGQYDIDGLHPPATGLYLIHSIVSRSPSASGIRGLQPKSLAALLISATTSRTSSGRRLSADMTGLPGGNTAEIMLARSPILTDRPLPALYTVFTERFLTFSRRSIKSRT